MGIYFFPSMQQQWVCVALLALLTVTVTLADGGKPEKQGNRTFYFLRHSYCSVLPNIAIFYPTLLYIYNPRLVCIALCYFILPHMLLYITLSAHIALYYLSMHYIIPHYMHTISPHMPLIFPEFLCITLDLSKFPFSRLQYIIPLCSIFTPYGSISLI